MRYSDITTDDPELVEILRKITKDALSVSEIIERGTKKRTSLYDDINSGKLVTFVSSGRRFALATDYARYLLVLKREGADAAEAETRSQKARDRRLKALGGTSPEVV